MSLFAPISAPAPVSTPISSPTYLFYQLAFWNAFWVNFTTKGGRRLLLLDYVINRAWVAAVNFLSNLVLGLVIVVVLILLINWVIIPIIKRVLARTKISETTATFAASTVASILKIILTLIFVDLIAAGFVTLTTFVAAFGIGLGQGLSNIAQNFVSGIMIISEDMLRIGDWIDCGDIDGEVVKIGLTHTTLRSMEGAHVVVQNSQLVSNSSGMMNWNKESKMQLMMPLLIRHNESVDLVRQMFLAVCAKDERVLASPLPVVYVGSIDASGLMLSLRCHTNNDDYWDVYYAMPEMIIKGCLALGISPQVARSEVEIPGLEADVRGISAELAAHRTASATRAASRKLGANVDDDNESVVDHDIDDGINVTRVPTSPGVGVMLASDSFLGPGSSKFEDLNNDADEPDSRTLEMTTYRVAKVSARDRFILQELQKQWEQVSTSLEAQQQRAKEQQPQSLIQQLRRKLGHHDNGEAAPSIIDEFDARKKLDQVVPTRLVRRKRRVRRNEAFRDVEADELQERQKQTLL